MNLEERIEWLKSHDFRIDTNDAPDLPQFVRNHIDTYGVEFGSQYIIWDPIDDEDGFKLCGDDLETMTREAIEHLDI